MWSRTAGAGARVALTGGGIGHSRNTIDFKMPMLPNGESGSSLENWSNKVHGKKVDDVWERVRMSTWSMARQTFKIIPVIILNYNLCVVSSLNLSIHISDMHMEMISTETQMFHLLEQSNVCSMEALSCA